MALWLLNLDFAASEVESTGSGSPGNRPGRFLLLLLALCLGGLLLFIPS